MSVSINDGFKQTLATGGETTIDFDFRIEESTDIRVLKTAVDNTLTELVNPTHYTVPGGSIGVDGGGVINLVTPAVAGEKYTCISNFTETRSTNFSLLGGFQSEELNKQLDRLTRIDQQLRRDINKTVNLREDSTVTGVTIPNPVASNLLGWDASATEMVNYAVGDVSGTLDATFTGLTTNDLIKWDGSKWVNTPNIQFSQIDANFIADATTTTPVTTDLIPFADVSNSNNTKKTTIQGILDLTSQGFGNNGYAANRYYFGGVGSPAGTVVVTANRLYSNVFIVGQTKTFTKIGLEVTALSAGNARLGVYNFANGVPTTLVADLGTVSTGTTGLKEVSITQALSSGIYVVAAVFDATPTLRGISLTSTISLHMYGTDSPSVNDPAQCYTAHTYGALPASFGALTYTNNQSFLMWMRA